MTARPDNENRDSGDSWDSSHTGRTRFPSPGLQEIAEDIYDYNRQHEERLIFKNRLEYLAMLFLLQFGNHNFVSTTTKCAEYKGISFLILYHSIHLIVMTPLQCQHLFLGYYSKYGYMKVWNIFPIGYVYGLRIVLDANNGTCIGASMMAFSLYTCIHWSSLIGKLVLLFALIPFMPEDYWTKCRYESENLPPCYDSDSDLGSVDCNKTYYPALAQYYRIFNLWRPDEKPDGIGPTNTKWIAASALVWMIVGILAILDFKYFKGIFAKMIYVAVSLFLVMMIVQWVAQGYAAQGTLLMLDFTGLYSYKVWGKAFTHAILMSHICEGTIIQIGSYAPANTIPDTDALIVGCLAGLMQFFGVFYVYSMCGWMANTYGLDIHCFIWPHETIGMALTASQLSVFPMSKLWIPAFFFVLFTKGIMEMTIVFTSTVNSFSEAFPSVKAYRSYLVTVATLICFFISLIFTTKVGDIFTHKSLDIVGTLATLLILAIMSTLILFSYSVSRLCDDIQFMLKFEPTLLMKAVFYLTPLLASYYGVSNLAVFLSTDPGGINTLYTEFWQLKTFLVVAFASIVTPLLLVGLIMYGIHVRTHTVELLFRPTKNWGYPDEEVDKARRSFNPKHELRYKTQNKPCAHICLLDNKRMQMEINKREAIRKTLKRYGFAAINEETEIHGSPTHHDSEIL